MPGTARLLTSSECGEISAAVKAAEQGRATLPQLARAHHLAESQGTALQQTIGILRDYMRAIIPKPAEPFVPSVIKQIILGIASGIITWALLGRKDENG